MKGLSTIKLQFASPFALLGLTTVSLTIVSGSSGLSYIGLHNSTSNQIYFLGIPFAQPPVGSLRFKPPTAWSTGNVTSVNATRNGDSCEQATGTTDNTVSEDYLTLNIWRPANITTNLPVLVYLFGGGFTQGDIARYPGTYLVERSTTTGKPVVYVAMDYRVGIYCFMPGSAAESAGAVNLGLKDQRLALEWIQQNIGYFGGDPTQVTIFGNSAGSISSSLQSMYKEGDIGGAFRGMILGSGFPSTFPVGWHNDSSREQAFQYLVNATSCAASDTPFECVINAPADVLRQANKDIASLSSHVLGPTMAPDDDLLPSPPTALIHSGKFAKVPFISGDQLDEATLAVQGVPANSDEDPIKAEVALGVGNVTTLQNLLSYYSTDPSEGSPYNTGNETFGLGAQYKRLASIAGDYASYVPRRDLLRTAIKFGVNTWSYVMMERPFSFVPAYVIRHGGNVPFWMQTQSISDPSISPGALEIQHMFGDYCWKSGINFAYNLDPNSDGGSELVNWPPYGENAMAIQLMSSNVTVIPDSNRTEAINFIIESGLYK